jgi:hypothetical protein
MHEIQEIISIATPRNARRVYPVVWSDTYREALRRVAAGEATAHASVDPALSPALLLCASGQFDEAEILILDLLKANLRNLESDKETFISFLFALLVVQRLDLLAALLKARFQFTCDLQIEIEDGGCGAKGVRWDIPVAGQHRFVFDSQSLQHDGTRVELLAFYWEFPLLAYYASRRDTETGSVFINRADIGQKPGLAYCDNRPDYFLIPDCIFVPTGGYQFAREVYRARQLPWQDRAPVAFWRGSTTGVSAGGDWRTLERIKLCEISRRHEEDRLFDAGISSIVQIFNPDAIAEIKTSGLVRGPVPWQNWGDYRFLIDIDGNSSPWSNLFQRLLSGSTVLKVESYRGLRQWFYGDLKPWHNYVPVAPDMSDLVDKVRWLQRNDRFAQRIGENGRLLAEELSYQRELERSVPVISSALRYFRDAAAEMSPYGMTLS